MKKTILITGGFGFVGKNCINKLYSQYRLVVIDNLSSGNKKFLNKNIKFYKKNINSNLNDIFKKNKFDYIIHCAANFANQNSIDNISKDMKSNIAGTINLLELSLKYKIKKFIYLSSSCVYNDENTNETIKNPSFKTPYAISKFTAEQYVSFYRYFYKLNATSFRLFNFYGKFDYIGAYRNVIPNFINKALNHKKIYVHGNGTSKRDFTFVEDLIKIIKLILKTPKKYNDIYNFGASKPITITNLAKKIIKLTGSKSKINFIQARRWDKFSKRKANNKKIKKDFKNINFTKIEDGLSQTINWMKKFKN